MVPAGPPPSIWVAPPLLHWQVVYEEPLDVSKAMVVWDPVSQVAPETNGITLRLAVYGLQKETGVCLLRAMGGRHDEVMCTMPDVRPTLNAFAFKSSVNPV